MLNARKAFSSFSVNDIQKAREFYGKTLELELSSGPKAPWLCPFRVALKLLCTLNPITSLPLSRS
jgi:hypothetical protein